MKIKVIILTIFVILGMIILPTIYKINKTHQEDLILVQEKEFEYYAHKCYKEGKCLNKNITLKNLYDNKYLTKKLTNPITKKYYKEESSINLDTKEIKLLS